MKIAFISSILFLCTYLCRSYGFMEEKVLVIDKFSGLCEGLENVVVTLHNLTLTPFGKSKTLNGEIIVKHDLNNEMRADAYLSRCANKDSLDNCESVHLSFPRCCFLLKAKGQAWSQFIENLDPPLSCPVKAGKYIIRNATFDVSTTIMPMGNFYWRAELDGYDVKTKEQVLCLRVNSQLVVVRKHP